MSKVSVLLFLVLTSACTSLNYHYDEIEDWRPPQNIEWCYIEEGITNKGNSCYWKPG